MKRIEFLTRVFMKNFKEWFSIKELMDENLNLPLPSSDKGIVKKAEREGWKKRQRDGVKGKTFEYHYSSFPEGVQKALGFYPEYVPQDHYIAESSAPYGGNTPKQTNELVNVPFYNTFASAGFGAFNDDVYEPDDFVGLSSRWLQQRGQAYPMLLQKALPVLESTKLPSRQSLKAVILAI